MLENFKNGYASSGSDQTAKGEKSDCAVSTIAKDGGIN